MRTTQINTPPPSLCRRLIGLCTHRGFACRPVPGQAKHRQAIGGMMFVLLFTTPAFAQSPPVAPPSGLTAKDHPNDTGTAIDLTWVRSSDDSRRGRSRVVNGYEIRRSAANETEFKTIGSVPYGNEAYTDQSCERDVEYTYQVAALGAGGARSPPAVLDRPVAARRQWFDKSRAWFGGIVLAVCGAVVFFTELVRSGRKLYVREIAGLRAIEDAVGRATEMGKPCLFVPGVMDMNEIATVAGVTLLSRVAKIAADYEATILVPTSRSLVMTAARETVQSAYLSAGRPEAYNEDRIYYVTDEQFGYVAHLTGLMVREKPAACFYAGTFYAESLILAETGNSVGAIQIAGTAESSQLPFFVAACDYTLLGEELFAASAYLSGEPHQLGSLKGQDAGKLIATVLLLAGCLLATLVSLWPEWDAAKTWFAFVKDVVLSNGAAG